MPNTETHAADYDGSVKNTDPTKFTTKLSHINKNVNKLAKIYRIMYTEMYKTIKGRSYITYYIIVKILRYGYPVTG